MAEKPSETATAAVESERTPLAAKAKTTRKRAPAKARKTTRKKTARKTTPAKPDVEPTEADTAGETPATVDATADAGAATAKRSPARTRTTRRKAVKRTPPKSVEPKTDDADAAQAESTDVAAESKTKPARKRSTTKAKRKTKTTKRAQPAGRGDEAVAESAEPAAPTSSDVAAPAVESTPRLAKPLPARSAGDTTLTPASRVAAGRKIDRTLPFGFGLAGPDEATPDRGDTAGDTAGAVAESQSPTAPPAEKTAAPADAADGVEKKKTRRGRRGGKRNRRAKRSADAESGAAGELGDSTATPAEPDESAPPTPVADESADAPSEGEDRPSRLVLKPRPPRRARGGRRRKRKGGAAEQESNAGDAVTDDTIAEDDATESAAPDASPGPQPDDSGGSATKGKRGRRKSTRGRRSKESNEKEESAAQSHVAAPSGESIEVIDLQQGQARPLKTGREMIINVTAGAECRIAILESGRLEELYLERQSAASHVGNIYMGRITNVEPSIQAAFVDFGLSKNGFLHISDVLPKYFPNNKGELEQVGKKVPRRDRPPIQKCFRRGDRVIVQVVKEGVGTKGPTLTTYLSIPGRFMVMMPGMDRLGVSRKIEDDQDRRNMRELLEQLNLPTGIGFILRTAGLNRTKRELQSDLNYLTRLWKTVEKRTAEKSAPCELYQESNLVIRTIRDVYSSDFKRIVVDDAATAANAREFLRIAMPRTPQSVVEYRRPEPIFHIFGIEQEIERIHSRHVPLPSGGSIVIDSTEAMVAIDVNSGKFRDLSDAEETAYRINLEAADEIARQLRLRDLGGLVVCDFIDLRIDRHKRAVEKALRDALKKHKERARILRMSKFGLIEMTRQRQRQSIMRSVFVDCPHCKGGGLIKAPESMSLEVIRILQLLAHRQNVQGIVVRTAPAVASLVLNDRRKFIHELELDSGKSIQILPNPTFASDQVEYECTDDRGMPMRVEV
jgi:ribonuclease E